MDSRADEEKALSILGHLDCDNLDFPHDMFARNRELKGEVKIYIAVKQNSFSDLIKEEDP